MAGEAPAQGEVVDGQGARLGVGGIPVRAGRAAATDLGRDRGAVRLDEVVEVAG
ncbi:hypothetical protein [Streptomyces mayteni]